MIGSEIHLFARHLMTAFHIAEGYRAAPATQDPIELAPGFDRLPTAVFNRLRVDTKLHRHKTWYGKTLGHELLVQFIADEDKPTEARVVYGVTINAAMDSIDRINARLEAVLGMADTFRDIVQDHEHAAKIVFGRTGGLSDGDDRSDELEKALMYWMARQLNGKSGPADIFEAYYSWANVGHHEFYFDSISPLVAKQVQEELEERERSWISLDKAIEIVKSRSHLTQARYELHMDYENQRVLLLDEDEQYLVEPYVPEESERPD